MKKVWMFVGITLVAGAAGIFLIFGNGATADPHAEEKRALAAFQTYIASRENQQFDVRYGQLSSAAQARVTKEQFVSKYRSIFAGIEADHVKIKPVFPPISFKGSVAMVKEET
ncbi:NTF2-like N-terminal transpeptidase domain-containing protein [Brevibacillus fluminis]|uniref:NTF2-like N-terminal transpeptidase domain-containing protein n=1 Tax=Brevibacillus fluminis TaxID=511487 RepID=UPI003F89978B